MILKNITVHLIVNYWQLFPLLNIFSILLSVNRLFYFVIKLIINLLLKHFDIGHLEQFRVEVVKSLVLLNLLFI